MRYYFDLQDGTALTPDEHGTEFASREQARREAVIGLTELARDWLPTDGTQRELAIIVREGERRCLQVRLKFEIMFYQPHGVERPQGQDR